MTGPSPWTVLAGVLAGANGALALVGNGTLASGTPVSLSLSAAPPVSATPWRR